MKGMTWTQEMVDAQNAKVAARSPRRCQFGEYSGRGCQAAATCKWGDHWFCDEHGKRQPLERKAPQVAAEPVPAVVVTVKPRRAIEPNATEREYLAILKAQCPGCTIRWEAYVLRLANRATYSPDFSVECGGHIDFYEVKGAYIFPKALVKPRIAAVMFPCHRFYLAQKKKTGWEVTELLGT